MAKVSVVIAAYNAETTIGRAVDSALGQRMINKPEVIVVDDGSTDGTADALKAYQHDRHIHVIRLPENRGPSHARNAGIMAAQGQFIALLDADDYMAADRLEKQLSVLECANDRLGIVVSWTKEIDEDGYFVRENRFRLAKSRDQLIHDVFLGDITAFTPTFMIRREVLDKIGLFDEELYLREDSDLLLRIITDCEIHLIEEPLVVRVITRSGLSRSTGEREFLRSRRRFFNKACRQNPHLLSLHRRYWAKNYHILGRLLVQNDPRRAMGYYCKSLNYRFRAKTAAAYCLAMLARVRGEITERLTG